MNLAILTPTRGRPHRFKIFNDSVKSLVSDNSLLKMYYYIDEDDIKLEEYKSTNIMYPENSFITVGPPDSISKTWNIIAKKAIDDGADVLIMGNDDLIYKTKNWDIILKEEIKKFPDDIYCIWFNDDLMRASHCAFPIISKKWYNCLGYFTPGVFHFGYNDTWIWEIGKKLKRAHFLNSVTAEHRHISRNPELNDDTYRRVRQGKQGNLFIKDGIIFKNTENIRVEHAEKLRKLISENSNL